MDSSIVITTRRHSYRARSYSRATLKYGRNTKAKAALVLVTVVVPFSLILVHCVIYLFS
jgi:hypothetical protein